MIAVATTKLDKVAVFVGDALYGCGRGLEAERPSSSIHGGVVDVQENSGGNTSPALPSTTCVNALAFSGGSGPT
jgi:hypothetical protein